MNTSREDIQRISIDSMADWERVVNNYKTSLLKELHTQIAAQGLQSEKEALIQHTERFISQMLTLAQPNLRINGRNFEDLTGDQIDVEPFDEALDRRVWSIADRRQGCHKVIAEIRRSTPARIAKSIEDLHEYEVKMEASLPGIEETVDSGDITMEDSFDDSRTEGFFKATAMAEELVQTIPSQTERSERFEEVATEIKGLKP
ncbi:hypothetical protein Moror_17694 [Moniliophthora roreri MCA 2997]|uniref:Uncharacterized protein n=2 Tax=Moniliophthora roreri TaxID=221103 RepID=V2XYA7_MONRO|nr:hypothetical protein Moror_17694 [Moniliophthora roreri MCA 2997]KAI3596728.1 hypothetical protein WG66_016350 [Moniliophthora roreri]